MAPCHQSAEEVKEIIAEARTKCNTLPVSPPEFNEEEDYMDGDPMDEGGQRVR